MRHRLEQGSDPQRVATDLEILERTLAELGTVVEDLERVPTLEGPVASTLATQPASEHVAQ